MRPGTELYLVVDKVSPAPASSPVNWSTFQATCQMKRWLRPRFQNGESHLVKSFLSVIKLRLQLKGSLFHDQGVECSFWKSFNIFEGISGLFVDCNLDCWESGKVSQHQLLYNCNITDCQKLPAESQMCHPPHFAMCFFNSGMFFGLNRHLWQERGRSRQAASSSFFSTLPDSFSSRITSPTGRKNFVVKLFQWRLVLRPTESKSWPKRSMRCVLKKRNDPAIAPDWWGGGEGAACLALHENPS